MDWPRRPCFSEEAAFFIKGADLINLAGEHMINWKRTFASKIKIKLGDTSRILVDVCRSSEYEDDTCRE